MGMGYQGLAQLQNNIVGSSAGGNYITLLITGSSINMALEPIYSTSIWGAGWYNAATNVHYADNAIRYEGSLDFELQASSEVWNLIRDWSIENRAFSKAARITPDGSWLYYYGPSQSQSTMGDSIDAYNDEETGKQGLWSQGFSLSTSEGSFVTGSLNCVGIRRTLVGPADGVYGIPNIPDSDAFSADPGQTSYVQDKFGLASPNNPLNPGGDSYDPIPYWRTEAYVAIDGTRQETNGVNSETLDWSVDLSNNTLILYTCRGIRGASAILQGPIDVSGNVTLYNPYGIFDPIFGSDPSTYNEFSPYSFANNTSFIATVSGAGVGIMLPAVVLESDDYSIRGQGEVTSRTFGMKGMGGKLISEVPSVDYISDVTYVGGVPSVTTGTINASNFYGTDAAGTTGDLSLPPLLMSLAS